MADRFSLFPLRRQMGRPRPARRRHRDRACCWSGSTCCSISGATASTMRCRRRTGTASSTRSSSSRVLATISVVISVYQLYLNQWLQIRWRTWLTTNISATGCTTPITTACSCGRRGRQPRPAHRRRHQAVRRADARHRPRPAELDRDVRLLRRHPVGPVGRRRRCICSAAPSTFPAIWSGPR